MACGLGLRGPATSSAAVTLLATPLLPYLTANIVMLFLLAVVAVAAVKSGASCAGRNGAERGRVRLFFFSRRAQLCRQ
jgi:hypothetical protein